MNGDGVFCTWRFWVGKRPYRHGYRQNRSHSNGASWLHCRRCFPTPLLAIDCHICRSSQSKPSLSYGPTGNPLGSGKQRLKIQYVRNLRQTSRQKIKKCCCLFGSLELGADVGDLCWKSCAILDGLTRASLLLWPPPFLLLILSLCRF